MKNYLKAFFALSTIPIISHCSDKDHFEAFYRAYENQLGIDLAQIEQVDQRNSADARHESVAYRCSVLKNKKEIYNQALEYRKSGGEKYLMSLKEEISAVEVEITDLTGKSLKLSC